MVEKLDKLVLKKEFKDRSDGIRQLVTVGTFVLENKPKIKDPEFIRSMEELRKNDSIIDWTRSLTDSELYAIYQAIELERETRTN